jgi:hypothetical protein
MKLVFNFQTFFLFSKALTNCQIFNYWKNIIFFVDFFQAFSYLFHLLKKHVAFYNLFWESNCFWERLFYVRNQLSDIFLLIKRSLIINKMPHLFYKKRWKLFISVSVLLKSLHCEGNCHYVSVEVFLFWNGIMYEREQTKKMEEPKKGDSYFHTKWWHYEAWALPPFFFWMLLRAIASEGLSQFITKVLFKV